MGVRDLSEFVGLIYDSVMDRSACPVMLSRLADLLGAASGVQFGTYDSTTHLAAVLAPRQGPEELHRFSEYWAAVSRRARKPAVGAVIGHESLIYEDHDRTNFFEEWSNTRGAEVMMGTILSTDGLISTVMSVSRPHSKGSFDPTEIELFAILIPHLQRGLQMLRMHLAALGGPRTSSVEMLNRFPQAVLLVDALARVIFANRAAEKVLGGGLSLGHDGLRGETLGETRLLRQAIANCAGPRSQLDGTGRRLRLSRGHRTPLTVLVVPHRSGIHWIDALRPTAILFMTDPEQAAEVRSEWLREDFGLTPAEAGFTREILKADGLRAAADRLGMSLTTARTHLARVFDKTGTRRQAELVRLILQSQPAVREIAAGPIRDTVLNRLNLSAGWRRRSGTAGDRAHPPSSAGLQSALRSGPTPRYGR
jgi:DNA-binding CsgD family transcriptional regulator